MSVADLLIASAAVPALISAGHAFAIGNMGAAMWAFLCAYWVVLYVAKGKW